MAQGYIILKHQVFGEITDQEALDMLPKESSVPVYKIFDIKREIIAMDRVHLLDNVEFRIYQKNLIEQEVKPYLNEHPDYKVLYFGKATIPLALHLGYCFGSWQDVEVYLFHRERMTWAWNNDDDRPSLPVHKKFVEEKFNAPIDVIYKVEATYLTQDDEMVEVVENASKTISLSLDTPGKDVFRSQDQLKAFAHQFSMGLDSVANFLPDTEKIHLFPTVPVGLAFLMGTKINPLLSKPIVTYQYDANKTPKNEQVLILQETPQSEVNMTDEDKAFIAELKMEFKAELEHKIAPFATAKKVDKEKQSGDLNWVRFILQAGDYAEIEKGYWKAMPDITQTIIKSSTLSLDTDKAEDGFYIGENDEWQINDRFIFNIMNRLGKDKAKILRALRLFLFHEALHLHQNLTNYTARNIGRFPRVLEEADYVADVWAMIHEYAYSLMHNNKEAKQEKDFFKLMIDVATKTMWAFDDLDPNNEEMQVRRVNRYLIWYWNYIQIDDRSCHNLQDIVNVVANKPLIEIRGLDIRAQSQRTIFRLTGFKVAELEIGYFQLDGKILRASNAGGLQLDEIVKGFRDRNGDKILSQLKSWYHQIR
jgi:hypothetical protein